jgi:hypothetical protein
MGTWRRVGLSAIGFLRPEKRPRFKISPAAQSDHCPVAPQFSQMRIPRFWPEIELTYDRCKCEFAGNDAPLHVEKVDADKIESRR